MEHDSTPGALGSNAGLGPNATLLDRLRSTAHWQLTEGNGDDATHQALQEAIAEIERLRRLLHELALAADAVDCDGPAFERLDAATQAAMVALGA